VSWIGHPVAPQPGQANRAPLVNVMSMSSRRATASKRLPDTTHGAASPNAVCNRSVSRMGDGSDRFVQKPCQIVRYAQNLCTSDAFSLNPPPRRSSAGPTSAAKHSTSARHPRETAKNRIFSLALGCRLRKRQSINLRARRGI
jgi:hypothetical protein